MRTIEEIEKELAHCEAFITVGNHGYRQGSVDGIRLLAHRVIWAMVHSVWPLETDHEDHDRTNNRLANLNGTDRSGNQRNRPRQSNSTSGVTGVYWHTRYRHWRAQIKLAGRHIHLGTFHNFNDAVAARKAAEIEHNFHPNHGAAA